MQVIPFTRRSITVKRFRIIGVPLLILATLTAVVALALTLFVPAVQAQPGGTEVFHGRVHPVRGASPQAVTNSLMTYHGGPISSAPVVYINYWGSQWNTGFYDRWLHERPGADLRQWLLRQRRRQLLGADDTNTAPGVAVGTTNCGTSGTHVGNQTGLLGGTWVDTTSLPRRISQSSIASAATRLMNHFGYSANAIYFVMTPSGRSMNGFGTQWCAWHDNTSTSFGQMAYAYQPYAPTPARAVA